MGMATTMTATATDITRERIAATEALIRPYVRRTPVIQADLGDFGLTAAPVTFKLEMLQHSGSFKARGAFANLLLRKPPAAGVVAASGGNHGAAVAYAAQRLGVPATIFVPEITSPAKIERIRDYGAQLVVARRALCRCAGGERSPCRRQTGAMAVHAYDQAETLLGQGTVGMEIEQDAPGIDTLLVAVGGGGLIGGIAAWYAGRVRVIAVEPEQAPTLHAAFAAGHAGRCARRRHRRRLAGAAPGRPTDVSDRARSCREGAAGERRRDPAGAGRAVVDPARRGRAGRRCGIRRAAVGADIGRRPASASRCWCAGRTRPR